MGLPAQITALRSAWPWLELKIDQTETLWPAVGMVHMMRFGSLRLLLVLAFPARLRALFLVVAWPAPESVAVCA